MKKAYAPLRNEEGFVLVMAIFMLAICSIIGVAAMMTSTTEVDIAGNERVHKETFYQAESGYVVGAEALIEKDAYGAWANNEKFADLAENSYIKIIDGDFLLEGRDDYPAGYGTWNKDHQNDTVEASPDIEMRIGNQYNVDIDVDKIAVRYIVGGGVEFAAGSEGLGVSTHKIVYNMDCVGTVPAWDTGNNRFVRALRLANGTINQATPVSEVIVGYGYVPRQ